MFEHHRQPLLPLIAFIRRLARSAAIAAGVVVGALALGALGYHALEGLPWIDAVLNAAMILSGMGPVNELHTTGCKLFATVYALFSGIVFLSVTALLFAPVMHRLMHRFHLELAEAERAPADEPHPAARPSVRPENR